jgi:hypothetical protein
VIGELEIIFGVDAIALHLRVACEILVFLEQLRGISAGTVVDAITVALVRVATLRALPATAATAAVCLTIIHQGYVVLSKPVDHSDPGCVYLLPAVPEFHRRVALAMAAGLQQLT